MHMAGYDPVETSLSTGFSRQDTYKSVYLWAQAHSNTKFISSLPSSSLPICWDSWEESIRLPHKKEKQVMSVCSASEQPFYSNLQKLEINNFKDQQTWIIINTINLRYLIQNNEMKYHSY